MQTIAHHQLKSPPDREERARKIKIVMLLPAIVICCAVMFIAS